MPTCPPYHVSIQYGTDTVLYRSITSMDPSTGNLDVYRVYYRVPRVRRCSPAHIHARGPQCTVRNCAGNLLDHAKQSHGSCETTPRAWTARASPVPGLHCFSGPCVPMARLFYQQGGILYAASQIKESSSLFSLFFKAKIGQQLLKQGEIMNLFIYWNDFMIVIDPRVIHALKKKL